MQEMADGDPWGYRYDSQALAGQAHALGQQPFGERVAELREARVPRWSRGTLSHHAWVQDEGATSEALIKAIETFARYPSARTMHAIARALGVQPDDFYEYRLAVARVALDERIVGLERALANLELVEQALADADINAPSANARAFVDTLRDAAAQHTKQPTAQPRPRTADQDHGRS